MRTANAAKNRSSNTNGSDDNYRNEAAAAAANADDAQIVVYRKTFQFHIRKGK